jgi:lipoprotein signal peptidase
VRKWFKSILAVDGNQSSKRLSAVLALFCCIAFAWIATFTPYQCPEYMYEGLLVIAGGGLGLTVIESIFTRYKQNNNESEGN